MGMDDHKMVAEENKTNSQSFPVGAHWIPRLRRRLVFRCKSDNLHAAVRHIYIYTDRDINLSFSDLIMQIKTFFVLMKCPILWEFVAIFFYKQKWNLV